MAAARLRTRGHVTNRLLGAPGCRAARGRRPRSRHRRPAPRAPPARTAAQGRPSALRSRGRRRPGSALRDAVLGDVAVEFFEPGHGAGLEGAGGTGRRLRPLPPVRRLANRVAEDPGSRLRNSAGADPANQRTCRPRGASNSDLIVDAVRRASGLLEREGLVLGKRIIDEAPVLEADPHGGRRIDGPDGQVEDERATGGRSTASARIATGLIEQ
jgi:hypothetical protein